MVSIRAPARGATAPTVSSGSKGIVSIRAPARGATEISGQGIAETLFQSAPPRGGRHPCSPCFFCVEFQSAPPRGGRQRIPKGSRRPSWFQSAPPRGGRHAGAVSNVLVLSFNPRPREGGDPDPSIDLRSRQVSIRAPARGATLIDETIIRDVEFQSAPPRGGRRRKTWKNIHDHGFNPRPREGGDSKL